MPFKDPASAIERLERLGFTAPETALANLKLMADGPLGTRIEAVATLGAASPSPQGCLNNLERILRDIPATLINESLDDDATVTRLVCIAGSSPMLANILARNPAYYKWLLVDNGIFETKDADAFASDLNDRIRDAASFDTALLALRLNKQKEFLRIGGRDLLGLADLVETTQELSDLASASLDAALSYAVDSLKKTHGNPMYADLDGTIKEAGLAIIGLGKLGGRELNFSSDIDILYIYSSDNGQTAGINGKPETCIGLHAFFVKAATMVTQLISRITDEGFVFRVDLNLRPDGKSGALANSGRSAEIYYESWGQSWERAALLKARVVAGCRATGDAFLTMIKPFIFRRHLDFTAIDEIKVMKEKIDLSLLRRSPDAVDVKLGSGGIREIEFFCQALQLIHAGREAALRCNGSLDALEALRLRGIINDAEAYGLRDAYVFLRRLEHRIQIVEGRQSQAIPAHPDELERLARMMGFTDGPGVKAGAAFWAEYKALTARVHDIYRSLFYKSDEDISAGVPENIRLLSSCDDADEARTRLVEAGFKDPESAYSNLLHLRDIAALGRLSPRSQLLLQRLTPVFLHRAVLSPDPDKALTHLERFISTIGPRSAFYSLLAENPAVIDELMTIFGTSVFLSARLIEHPESLDHLLSRELSIPYRRKNEYLTELDADVDYETAIDELRRLKNQEVFRVAINDIRGNLTPRMISAQITFLAEVSLDAAIKIAASALRPLYGTPLSGRFAILGLGKLGSKELIYGSDLDIVFVYDDCGAGCMTAGARRISCSEYFVKLAQRIMSVLTIRTREGFVFEVDARLRPSGSAGPLVVSREAMLNYHVGATSVWERQAYLRARPVAGDIACGASVLAELAELIYLRPFTKTDAGEMLRIRGRMEMEIAKESKGRYNLKAGKGGLNDIEFLVQAMQLAHGSARRGLRTPDTRKALHRLGVAQLLPPDSCLFLSTAYNFYRRLELKQRIVNDRPDGNLVAGTTELTALARRAGYAGHDPADGLIADYNRFALGVREVFLETLKSLGDSH